MQVNKRIQKAMYLADRHRICLIGSNRNTGKSTCFQFDWLDKAVNHGLRFHIIAREINSMAQITQAWLIDKNHYSTEQKALLDQLEYRTDGERHLIVIKSTDIPIAECICIKRAVKYKRVHNLLHATKAIFDEMLDDDGMYIKDEPNKLASIIVTMRKTEPTYSLVGLYNLTHDYYPYWEFFGCQNRHSSGLGTSGAYFHFFVGEQITVDAGTNQDDILAILQKTSYGRTLTTNGFAEFPQYLLGKHDYTLDGVVGYVVYRRVFYAIRMGELDGNAIAVLRPTKSSKIKKQKPKYYLNYSQHADGFIFDTVTQKAFQLLVKGARLYTDNPRHTYNIRNIVEQQLTKKELI